MTEPPLFTRRKCSYLAITAPYFIAVQAGGADKIATRAVNISIIGRGCASVSCDRSLPSQDNDQ